MRTFRHFAVSLALAATLLRALLPEGWMPNPSGAAGTPVVICTVYGLQHIVLNADGNPVNPSDQKHSNVCAFAAAAHLAPPASGGGAVLPCHAVSFAACLRPQRIASASRFLRHAISPRAPPQTA
jgi:hypothetical protein